MPNHVKNVLSFSGQQDSIASLRAHVARGDRQFDFDTIIPMPPELRIDAVSPPETHAERVVQAPYSDNDLLARLQRSNREQLGSPIDLDDDGWNTFIAMLQNYRKHRHFTWYSWACDNWGTKWNAYDFAEYADGAISFETAWSAPLPVLLKLSEMFPDVQIHHRYADEDIGSNYGELIFLAGVQTKKALPEGNEFSFRLWHGDDDPAKHGRDANFEYSEEIDEANNS
jgi:hypothetical protein